MHQSSHDDRYPNSLYAYSALHCLQDLGVISAASWLRPTHILEALATAADISADNNDGLGRSE